MKRHEAGDAHVVPIIIRPCDRKSAPFGRLNALPTDAKPVTKWTDLDDAFLDEFIARFFENSLQELSRRNPALEGRFRRIDANRFTAVAYRSGRAVARCTIFFGGLTGRGPDIGYSSEDEQSLCLKPLGMSSILGRQQPSEKLSEEGAAELLWSLGIDAAHLGQFVDDGHDDDDGGNPIHEVSPHHEQRFTWGARNAGTGRCRLPIVEESGSAEDRCSVNRAFMRPLCGLYALAAVDGTAAGHAFCPALVVSLLQGRERGEAVARACAAGAIAASRPGAQRSLPTAAELEEILARY